MFARRLFSTHAALRAAAKAAPSAPKEAGSKAAKAAPAAPAAAKAVPGEHKTVAVGVLLKRNPVVLPELSEFQQAYRAYREAMERDEARPFDSTFYFKKGSVAEQRWLAAQEAAAALGPDQHLVQPKEEELLKLRTAPRITAADAAGDVKSLDRALARSLYLVVQHAAGTQGWRLPQGPVVGEQLLHEAASERLAEACGSAMETWVVGKAPVGHAKDGNKTVFYMKAHIFSGKIVPSGEIKDHAWLTKEELASKLDPAYYAQISGMLSDL
nr:54S ribosomal protein L17 mitochondrial [Polyrhizophydium stewartii]